MGKTTLVGVAAARSGLALGWGTGAEAERTPAFWPWTAALRALLSTVDPAEVAELTGTDATELARLLPQLADGTGAGDPDSPTDAAAARLRLFDAVARFLERLARRRPTLVVLDDLQWADESSLQLLEFITQPVRPVPLVIVGAYRHDELGTDAARVLARIAARGESLPLHGLSAGEVFGLVAAAVGGDAARGWAAEVHRRSGWEPVPGPPARRAAGRSGPVRGCGTGWRARPRGPSGGAAVQRVSGAGQGGRGGGQRGITRRACRGMRPRRDGGDRADRRRGERECSRR